MKDKMGCKECLIPLKFLPFSLQYLRLLFLFRELLEACNLTLIYVFLRLIANYIVLILHNININNINTYYLCCIIHLLILINNSKIA